MPLTIIPAPAGTDPRLPQTYGKFETGNNVGDYAQYQEKNFSYYATEEGIQQNLWFRAQIVDTPPGSAQLYFGFTPTKDNAIFDRDYGYGFQFNPGTNQWAFRIDNLVDGVRTSLIVPLEGGTPSTIAFKIDWPEPGFEPELWLGGQIEIFWVVPYEDQYTKTIGINPEEFVLNQQLRLTFGARNLISAPARVGLGDLKEVFIRDEYIDII